MYLFVGWFPFFISFLVIPDGTDWYTIQYMDNILVKQFVETGSELVFEILFILVCMPKFVHDFEI